MRNICTKLFAAIAGLIVLNRPVAAFDTFWHAEATQKVGEEYGFTTDEARAAAVFLHFDNLKGKLDRNSKFDYIFNQLLANTRKTLADYNDRRDLDQSTRKTLILVTLGASLHTVQDFYSHSDWIHNDFDSTPVKMVRSGPAPPRAPT